MNMAVALVIMSSIQNVILNAQNISHVYSKAPASETFRRFHYKKQLSSKGFLR